MIEVISIWIIPSLFFEALMYVVIIVEISLLRQEIGILLDFLIVRLCERVSIIMQITTKIWSRQITVVIIIILVCESISQIIIS